MHWCMNKTKNLDIDIGRPPLFYTFTIWALSDWRFYVHVPATCLWQLTHLTVCLAICIWQLTHHHHTVCHLMYEMNDFLCDIMLLWILSSCFIHPIAGCLSYCAHSASLRLFGCDKQLSHTHICSVPTPVPWLWYPYIPLWHSTPF